MDKYCLWFSFLLFESTETRVQCFSDRNWLIGGAQTRSARSFFVVTYKKPKKKKNRKKIEKTFFFSFFNISSRSSSALCGGVIFASYTYAHYVVRENKTPPPVIEIVERMKTSYFLGFQTRINPPSLFILIRFYFYIAFAFVICLFASLFFFIVLSAKKRASAAIELRFPPAVNCALKPPLRDCFRSVPHRRKQWRHPIIFPGYRRNCV